MSVRIAGGVFAGRVLTGPPRPDRRRSRPTAKPTRPTAVRLRKSLFTVVADDLVEARVLDLFAGVGTLGFEAVSRGARQCVFVERSPRMARVIERNAERLEIGAVEVVVGDALRELRRFGREGRRFEVVFLDPPWEDWETGTAAKLIGEAIGLAPLVVAEHRSSWTPPVTVTGAEPESGSSHTPPAGVKTRTTAAGDGAFSLYRREEETTGGRTPS